MKKYIPIYYLLFILLVMGTFASMAQNSYGLKIVGGVAFVFALVFLIQGISILRKITKVKVLTVIEPFCLFVIAVILGLRVFYIHFSFVEILFVAASGLLALLYTERMIKRVNHLKNKNSYLAFLMILFHLCIILFLLTLAVFPFLPAIANITGMVAFILLVVFVLAGLAKSNLKLDGEEITAFRMVRLLRDHSIVIITLFILFSLYTGLNKIGALPGIYTDEYPRAYFDLLNNSSQEERSPDGVYKYQEFMKKYQDFIKRNKK